ncbi:MAG TPA: hypothetical protein VGR10_07870, partial [Thermoleophilaceae bacterium]|nr:hypothetical protein [Thermoleophilaceae bacterium]
HRDGAFAAHVESLELVTPTGERLRAGPAENRDVLAATAGGMGLTGVIAEATLRLLRIETSRMSADTERAADLDELMALMGRATPATATRWHGSTAWPAGGGSGARS